MCFHLKLLLKLTKYQLLHHTFRAKYQCSPNKTIKYKLLGIELQKQFRQKMNSDYNIRQIYNYPNASLFYRGQYLSKLSQTVALLSFHRQRINVRISLPQSVLLGTGARIFFFFIGMYIYKYIYIAPCILHNKKITKTTSPCAIRGQYLSKLS